MGTYVNTTFYAVKDLSEADYNWTVVKPTLRDDTLYEADKAVAAVIWLLWMLFLSWPVLLFFIPMLFLGLVCAAELKSISSHQHLLIPLC